MKNKITTVMELEPDKEKGDERISGQRRTTERTVSKTDLKR